MPRITEIWAYIAGDTNPDDEGVITASMPFGIMLLVGVDKERMESLRPLAREICVATGKVIKLIRFENRIEIEDIIP